MLSALYFAGRYFLATRNIRAVTSIATSAMRKHPDWPAPYYLLGKAAARAAVADHESHVGLNLSVANRPQPVTSKLESSKDATRNDAVTDTHSNVRGKAFEKGDFTLNDDLLSRFEFTLAGRETLNGRPMLILEFKPADKKLPERHIKDKFINKAAGRLWVDEADYVLAKADVHLTETVNVVGGLVGAVWKFIYTFSRERLPDGLWFTRDVDWHLEGREIIVRRSVEYHERKTGVRKVW